MEIATDHHRMADKKFRSNIISRLPRRVFIGIIAYLIAIGVSFMNIQYSVFLFTLIIIPAAVLHKRIV